MKLSVSKNAEAMKDTGNGGGFINNSGIYDITLNYVQVADTKNGAKQLNFNVTNQGQDQTIYGPILFSTEGKLNEITNGLLNRLCIIAGMEDGQDIELEEAEYPVGKDQKMMEMAVIAELAGLDVKVRIQMEYSVWKDAIQERKAVKAFYREDGATAAESESGEDIGTQLAIHEDKYASNITYKDGLTADDVADWQKTRFSKADAAKDAPKAKSGAKRPLFGK